VCGCVWLRPRKDNTPYHPRSVSIRRHHPSRDPSAQQATRHLHTRQPRQTAPHHHTTTVPLTPTIRPPHLHLAPHHATLTDPRPSRVPSDTYHPASPCRHTRSSPQLSITSAAGDPRYLGGPERDKSRQRSGTGRRLGQVVGLSQCQAKRGECQGHTCLSSPILYPPREVSTYARVLHTRDRPFILTIAAGRSTLSSTSWRSHIPTTARSHRHVHRHVLEVPNTSFSAAHHSLRPPARGSPRTTSHRKTPSYNVVSPAADTCMVRLPLDGLTRDATPSHPLAAIGRHGHRSSLCLPSHSPFPFSVVYGP
jgi:hypothetical protein